MTTVYIGEDINDPDFTFNEDTILDLHINTAVNISMDELTADTAEIEVWHQDTGGVLRGLPWAIPVWICQGSDLIGRFYLTNVKRVGENKYQLNTTSAVGLFEYDRFYGGMYNGDTFQSVLENIVLTNGVSIFAGYSRILHRGKYGDMDDYSKSGAKHVIATLTESTSFGGGSVTDTKLVSKFTLYSCLLNDSEIGSHYAELTALRIPILGCCSSQGHIYSPRPYGMYMDISRTGINDPWPDFGELFFQIDTLAFSLGTPTGEISFDIVCDPIAGTLLINGNSFDISSLSTDWSTNLSYYGGGILYKGYAVIDTSIGVTLDVKYTDGAYRLVIDAAVFEDISTGRLYPGNLTCGVKRLEEFQFAEADESEYIQIQQVNYYQKDFAAGIEYAAGVASIPVYGWLPVCTKREALHQLLFSTGVALRKTDDGRNLFTALSDSAPESIPQADLYDSGSVESADHINEIEIYEHYYQNKAISQEIYRSEGALDSNRIVVYTGGIASGRIVNHGFSDVVDFNCNAAIVKGTGYLTSYYYNTSESVRTRKIGDYTDGKSVSVSDASLVTLSNSELILDRLAALYSGAYKVENEIVLAGEHCGQFYSFNSPFKEAVTGFLIKISSALSSVIKSSCEFLCGYIPPDIGAAFTMYVVLKGSGTWTVPDSVFEKTTPRIRIVLIGGGQGGQSGSAGEDGEATPKSQGSTAAKGGKGGEFGSGGKIYEVTIENPSASYSFQCGEGGSGGDISLSVNVHNNGSLGTASTITDGIETYSSESGETSETGYQNFFTGETFAARMKETELWGKVYETDETTGDKIYGDGGCGGYVMYRDNIIWHYGGQDIKYGSGYFQKSYGGECGANYPPDSEYIITGGGTGGGAAAGSDGAAGEDAYYSGNAHAGNGGAGADATEIPAKAWPRGDGGHGGYGGGGGGSSGFAVSSQNPTIGSGGHGGYGGRGGDGGDGCIIIYY